MRRAADRWALLMSVLLVGSTATASLANPLSAPLVGRPLADVLEELRSQGLELIWGSTLVPREMTVESEPVSREPRAILREILAPHGLVAREGAGGILMVVADREPAEGPVIEGTVRALDGRSLAGVVVALLDPESEVVTDERGDYRLTGLSPGSYDLEARAAGYVVERRRAHAVEGRGRPVRVDFRLQPAPATEEAIEVVPSRISLLQSEPSSPLALRREEILGLPHLGNDVFRAFTLLPGTTGNDLSARFHLRGGRRDEVQVLLDSQELYEAYHLLDYDGAFSIVEPQILGRVDLTTGGFPARYGDRMGGVLDMTTVTVPKESRYRVGLGVLAFHAGASGSFSEGRGSWVGMARRGSLDLSQRLLRAEDPSYWDLFGRAELFVGDRQAIGFHLLHSSDALRYREGGEETKDFDTRYDNSYFWFDHRLFLGDRGVAETALAWSRVVRDRRGREDEELQSFETFDDRELSVVELRHSWTWQPSGAHLVDLGFEVRRFDASYEYFGDRHFETKLAQLRHLPGDGTVVFDDSISGDHYGAHLGDRMRIGDAVTLELSLRYDQHEATGDRLWSPRSNLAWSVGRSGVMRFAWGTFHQSQRPYELAVEDGETSLAPAERAEHRIVGYEHLFGPGSSLAGWALRAEIYERRVHDPRPRYENLWEPINLFPEMEPDRVRIDPERSRARGLELFARGPIGAKWSLWLNYTWSRSEDRLEGHWVPSQIDQPHALNFNLAWRMGPRWTLDFAWRYHSGWPTTPVSLVLGEGPLAEVEDEDDAPADYTVVLGPLNSRRLAPYHRLDLRASRAQPVRRGTLTFYIDVQNLYNRKNLAGFDIEIDEEESRLEVKEESWLGFFPSLGLLWSF